MWGQIGDFVDSGMKQKFLIIFVLNKALCFSLGNLELPGNKKNILPTARYHISNI